MSVWERLHEWLVAVIVASVTWVAGLAATGLPLDDAPSSRPASAGMILGWAQQVEQPAIEQVGEDVGDDVETLDQGAPAAASTADVVLEDGGVPVAAQGEDIETLDQGAPPAADAPSAETVYVAPASETAMTFDAAPAGEHLTGPRMPEGFGTGRVQAIAGRGETPIGLAECHVGVVTGRAFVGIDCGEDQGSSFVGHAPSFEEFPFVLEAEFPFEGDEAFFTDPDFPFGDDDELAAVSSNDDGSETDVFVSSRGGNQERDDEATTAPVIETGGESSVAFAQRTREREPRVRTENRGRDDEVTRKRPRSNGGNAGTSAESREDERKTGNGRNDGANAEGNDKENKKAKGNKSKNDKEDSAERKEKKRSRNRR